MFMEIELYLFKQTPVPEPESSAQPKLRSTQKRVHYA